MSVKGSDEEKIDESMSGDSEQGKDEESSGVNKDPATDIVNVDDLNSDEEPLAGIAKRLKSMKGEFVMTESQPYKAAKKKVVVGPSK